MPRIPLPLAGSADLAFPIRGIDRDSPFGAQRPQTTPDAVNVVAFEPLTDRMRGGSRPGLGRVVAGRVPAGDTLIQGLGVVIIAGEDGLFGPPEDPDPGTGLPPIEDPSSVGDPTSWGDGPLYNDPVTGLPVTGGQLHTRVPPGRVIRHGGSGAGQSNNTPSNAPVAANRCFRGNLRIRVRDVDPPDIYHWNGQLPAFSGGGCFPYYPPLLTGPVSALAFPSITSQINTLFEEHIGSGSYDIVTDSVTGPGGFCTFGYECP